MNTQNKHKEKKASLPIKPYARLLTMLGDQLIKDERIALIELIKNSYDADAKWVKISFENFILENGLYSITPTSKIIIEDDGIGMTYNTIQNGWMNPATPHKYSMGSKGRTKEGRVIQGEKGIGRFATLKLGKTIKITTRSEENGEEYEIDYDLAQYDDDFLSKNGKKEEIYLSDIAIDIYKNTLPTILDTKIKVGNFIFPRKTHGTKIEISNLRGSWTEKKLEKVYDNVSKLESIFTKIFKDDYSEPDKFNIGIELNGEKFLGKEHFIETMRNLLENDSIFVIEGSFDDGKGEFTYNQTHGSNVVPKTLPLEKSDIKGLYVYRQSFLIEDESNTNNKIKVETFRKPECGSFSFKFYIFDFSKESKSPLDSDQKNIIKKHRIYLYRDGIRVYPYGDPENDWLNIDVLRGTISAGQFFSNDQVVGYVQITHDGNPLLKDKTNREGLIEEGNATADFTALVQTLLSYIRIKDYKQYQLNTEHKKPLEIYKSKKIQSRFSDLQEKIKSGDSHESLKIINELEKEYTIEKNYLVQRAETTEELAGVGLSVETASHDILSFMSKATIAIDDLIKDIAAQSITLDKTFDELNKIKGLMSFVDSQLRDIQLLFRSAKRRRKQLRVGEMVNKVERIYKRLLEKENIKFEVTVIPGSPLVAKANEAVILQLLINLFDNAIYWLAVTNNPDKKILITLDGQKGEMIFSDNGPGINKEDKAYLFEPFYSGRGEEGKGLGLYIARQLLERLDYSIELADTTTHTKLSGANFVISFVPEENL